MRVSYKDSMIWTTEKDVKVQKALSADIDRDEQDWVQHIFVYEFLQEDVQAKWMSSYIGKDILNITARAAETSGDLLCLTDRSGEESVWGWDSWGFTKIEN